MPKLKHVALLLILITAAGCSYISYLKSNPVPSGLIRLHVIANSNTFYDQQLKYQVKDRIVAATRNDFSQAASIEEARQIADSSAEKIALAAADEIKRQGFNYPVKVIRGAFQFPAKTYTIAKESGQTSRLTLPPGEYEAVRVIIGDGKGANWWCVLYPPLCFVDLAKTAPTASIAAASALEKQVANEYGNENALNEDDQQYDNDNEPEDAKEYSIDKEHQDDKPKIAYRIKAVEFFCSLFH